MDEQIFLPEKVNFNLCNPKAKTKTIIYAVVFFRGRQYKINTGVKIIPSQWNKDKQMAIISNCFSKLDNANNKIVNKRINIIYEHYNDFKEYICNVEDIESEFYEVLKRKLNKGMATRRNMKQGSFESEFRGLIYELSESRRNKYKKIMDEIISFMKAESIPLEWKSITKDMLYKYACNLANNNDLQIRTFNDKIDNTYFLLNHADEHDYLSDYDKNKWSRRFHKIKETRSEEEKQSVNIALPKETISKLLDYNFETDLENEVRDIFAFLCLTGLSEGDLAKIWDENFIKWNNNNIQLYRNKTGVPAIVPLVDDRVSRIYDKYKNGFHYTKIKGILVNGKLKLSANEIGRLNKTLHKIFKNSSFEDKITVTRTFVGLKNGQIIAIKKKDDVLLSEEINIYDSRHTFITMAYYDGMDKELIRSIVGHTSNSMIDKIYLKCDQERDISKKIECINAHYSSVSNIINNDVQQSKVSDGLKESSVSLNDYENKAIENYELKKQLAEAHKECSILKTEKLYNSVFTIDDYQDYVGDRAMETDQECISRGEKP